RAPHGRSTARPGCHHPVPRPGALSRHHAARTDAGDGSPGPDPRPAGRRGASGGRRSQLWKPPGSAPAALPARGGAGLPPPAGPDGGILEPASPRIPPRLSGPSGAVGGVSLLAPLPRFLGRADLVSEEAHVERAGGLVLLDVLAVELVALDE